MKLGLPRIMLSTKAPCRLSRRCLDVRRHVLLVMMMAAIMLATCDSKHSSRVVMAATTTTTMTRTAAFLSPPRTLMLSPTVSHSSSSSSSSRRRRRRRRFELSSVPSSSASASTSSQSSLSSSSSPRPCFYQGPGNQWSPRVQLQDLQIGQELYVTDIVQELLLNGAKTGPKLFCEVGVGRYTHSTTRSKKEEEEGKWHMVFAMLRLPREKLSVTKKRTARLRKKCKQKAGTSSGNSFPVYVSRIRLANGQLEVCLTQEEALEVADMDKQKNKKNIPLSSLTVGQELTGRVMRVEPYGVLVDLDRVNRPGLLHIQKVADLYGTYIDKEKGLQQTAGLERGTRLQVQVAAAVQQKRLFLDFTDSAKQMAEKERQKQENAAQQKSSNDASDGEKIASTTSSSSMDSSTTAGAYDDVMSEDEMAAWAAYAASEQDGTTQTQRTEDYDNDDDDDDADYDEDRDIEDALGLGTY